MLFCPILNRPFFACTEAISDKQIKDQMDSHGLLLHDDSMRFGGRQNIGLILILVGCSGSSALLHVLPLYTACNNKLSECKPGLINSVWRTTIKYIGEIQNFVQNNFSRSPRERWCRLNSGKPDVATWQHCTCKQTSKYYLHHS